MRLTRGGLLYVLCTSSFPYSSVNDDKLDPLPNGYSQQLRGLIERCLNLDPNARPDALELLRETMTVL